MSTSRWSRFADILLVTSAVIVAALVVRRELFSGRGSALPQPRRIDNWQEIARRGHVQGNPGAPVRVVQFSDFQCPFCAQVQPRLRRLQHQYPADVAILYRHFPLTTPHPHAYAAALASECAAAQGRFQEYEEALYAEQDSIGTMGWDAFGKKAGVPDLADLMRCVREKRFAGAVDTDLAAARSLDLLGTPTLIVNGTELVGPSLVELEQRVAAVVREVQRAKPRQP